MSNKLIAANANRGKVNMTKKPIGDAVSLRSKQYCPKMASNKVENVFNIAFIQVSRKFRHMYGSFLLYAQDSHDSTGPKVQNEMAGVMRSAGCAMIVLVALLIPRARQRITNAYGSCKVYTK